MKVWWQQLNSREQQLIGLLTPLIAVFLFYSFIWQPLNTNLEKGAKKLARQQQLLTWVQENTERYQQAKGNKSSAGSKGSLSSIVNRTAKQQQITIDRIQMQTEDIQVWVDEVAFNQLLQWLELLANNEGLYIKAIDLSDSDKVGVVRVRRLQLGSR